MWHFIIIGYFFQDFFMKCEIKISPESLKFRLMSLTVQSGLRMCLALVWVSSTASEDRNLSWGTCLWCGCRWRHRRARARPRPTRPLWKRAWWRLNFIGSWEMQREKVSALFFGLFCREWEIRESLFFLYRRRKMRKFFLSLLKAQRALWHEKILRIYFSKSNFPYF